MHHKDTKDSRKINRQEALDNRAKFKQGWKEAMNGETSPLSELWDDVDGE